MKKLFFFLAALTLSFTAQAAIINAHPNGGEDGVLTWFIGQAAEGDTVLLADGEYIQTYSVDVQTPGIVIKAAEGAKPIIKAESYFKIHKTTIWEGITFDGLNQGEHALVFRGTNAKNLILKDCEIKNYPKCLVYCDAGYHVDSLIIDNCLLHDAGRVAVYVATSTLEGNVHGCDYFEMTNSTVYNINSTDYSAGAIDIRSNNNASGMQNEILMDHVTLYNCQSTGDYGIIASYKSGNVKISNSIAANPEVFGNYSFRVYEGVEVANCLYYNASPKSGASYTGMIENQDPLFLNPSAGDFNLQPGSPAIGAATDGTNLGDPRWKVAAAELAFAMAAPAADVEATDLYTIKWTVLDPDGDATIKLEYKAEEGDWTTIAENIPSTQSAYDWNIRHMPAQTVAIRGTLANATKSIVSEAAGKLTIVPEAVAPRPVRNLAGEVTENTLTLNWINPDQVYEVSNTLETLEGAESYISNDGTAEVTLSEDKKEVSVAYNTTEQWHMAGVKVPVTADYVNTLACELKRDAADGTQIQVTIEQNGFDWWYLIIDDIATEWTEYEFTEFEKLGWHNNSDAAVLDGTNVTAVYFATNHGSGVSGTLSLRNLTLNGAVPAVNDYAKTVICISEVAYPTTIVAEEVVYEGAASTCTLNIDPTKDLYVSVFAQDDLGNTSVAAQYKYTAPAVEEYVIELAATKDVVERNGRIRVNFLATDETHGEISLTISDYIEGQDSYVVGGTIGEVHVDGTATLTIDATKEVLVAEVAAEDGSAVYDVTLTYTYPLTKEYTFLAMDDAEATVEDLGEEGDPFLVYSIEGAGTLDGEPVEFELMVDVTGYLEGVINEVFVSGEATQLVDEEGFLYVVGTAMDDAGNTYKIEVNVPLSAGGGEQEITIVDEYDFTLYNLNLEVMGDMAMVTAGGDAGVSFWLKNLTPMENYYGLYTSDSFSNIWFGGQSLQPYGDGQYTPEGLTVAFISTPDDAGNAVKYNFTLKAGDDPSATALDNVNTTVAPAKAIVNGQLVILKEGVKYNAQGAVL